MTVAEMEGWAGGRPPVIRWIRRDTAAEGRELPATTSAHIDRKLLKW